MSHTVNPTLTLESLVRGAQFIVLAKRVTTPFDSEPFEIVETLLGPPSLSAGTKLTVYSSSPVHDYKLFVAEEMKRNRAANGSPEDGIPGLGIPGYDSSVREYDQAGELILFLAPFDGGRPDEFQFVELGAYESVAQTPRVAALIAKRSSDDPENDSSDPSLITLESLVREAQLIVVAKRQPAPPGSEPFQVVETLLGPPSLSAGTKLTVYSSMHEFNLMVAEAMNKNQAANRSPMDGIPGMIIESYPSSLSPEEYQQDGELLLFLVPFHSGKPDEVRFVEMGAYESVAKRAQVAALISQRNSA